MGRRKGIVDPDVTKLCKFGHEGLIVVFLFLVETGVFQAEDIAVLHRRHSILRGLADAIVGERDGHVDGLRQRRNHGFRRILGIASLGPAEMRQQDYLAAFRR